MTLKQYEAVFYAVNTKTLTKAGEKLKTSQTAVSHLIADLEKELGFKIINRGKNGVTLTTEGGRLFPFIQEVVFANERAVNYAKKLKSENEVTINVGTFSSVAVNWLPAIIKEFNTFHPEVHFNIIDGGYGDILKALGIGIRAVEKQYQLLPELNEVIKRRFVFVGGENKGRELTINEIQNIGMFLKHGAFYGKLKM